MELESLHMLYLSFEKVQEWVVFGLCVSYELVQFWKTHMHLFFVQNHNLLMSEKFFNCIFCIPFQVMGQSVEIMLLVLELSNHFSLLSTQTSRCLSYET
jgi:hypothetical protein